MCCAPPPQVIQSDALDAASNLFKALGDPSRLIILSQLARSDCGICVCDFASALNVHQPTISHHLRLLREAGLVASVRRGTWVYYSLAADVRSRFLEALSILLPEKVIA